MNAASNLLERAAALLEEDDTARIELEVDLGDALLESGRLTEAESLLESTVARPHAPATGSLTPGHGSGSSGARPDARAQSPRGIRRELEPLVTVFEAADDHRGAADALRLLGKLATWANYFTGGLRPSRTSPRARARGR